MTLIAAVDEMATDEIETAGDDETQGETQGRVLLETWTDCLALCV